MFRKLYNMALLNAELKPDGPVLIAEGRTPVDPVAPDLAFVRTRRDGRDTVYLPGASIKGVLRSHSESLLATALGEPAAENPFDHSAPRRTRAHEKREDGDTAAVYRLSCEADRLFGSTEIAGRLSFADALPPKSTKKSWEKDPFHRANQTEVRYGVAIDREKQSVAVGPFEQEAVTQGHFELRLTLESFELWMLALVLNALRDLHLGRVRLGHAKSRGFGAVKVEKPRLKLLWPGARPERLEGAGCREADPGRREQYGLVEDDTLPLPKACKKTSDGLLEGYSLESWKHLEALLDQLREGPWKAFRARAENGHG